MNFTETVLYAFVLFSSGYLAGTLSSKAEIKKIKNKVERYRKLMNEDFKRR